MREEQKIIEYLKDRGFNNSVIGSTRVPAYSKIGDPYAMRNVSVTVASAMAEYITQRSEGAAATTPKQPDNSEALREIDNVIEDFKFKCEGLKSDRISVVARNIGLMLEGEVDKLSKIRALIGGENEALLEGGS